MSDKDFTELRDPFAVRSKRIRDAAPEMLAALKWIAEHYPASKAGQRAMDAIAKAEGKS